jgi:trk system potassium uptake protein TrkA
VHVIIVGAGQVGSSIADDLDDTHEVVVIERDPARAQDLNYSLNVLAVEGDGTAVSTLEEAGIADADMVIASTDDDETNLLVSLLAHRLGVERTVAVIDNTAYVDLFETVGVDVGVSPREVVAEEITRFTREGGAENVALIESDRAEVLEIEIDDESVLAGRPIRESVADLPQRRRSPARRPPGGDPRSVRPAG